MAILEAWEFVLHCEEWLEELALRIATAAAGSFWNTSDAKMLMLG
jgi:hypothetical protein